MSYEIQSTFTFTTLVQSGGRTPAAAQVGAVDRTARDANVVILADVTRNRAIAARYTRGIEEEENQQ